MTVQAGIGQSRAPGLLQALAPPHAVLPLTAIPVCAFLRRAAGIYIPEPRLCQRGRPVAMPSSGGPPQSRLYGVSGEIEAGRTSGQAVPKPHHTGCDDEVRSAGLGKAPQHTFFRFCPHGKVWPHLPCLPKRADSKIAVFENYVTLPPCILPLNMLK